MATTPSLRELVQSQLNDHFEKHKDTISKEGPMLDSFLPHSDAWLSPLWKKTTSTADGSAVDFRVAGRHAEEVKDGFISTNRPDLLMHGLDDIAADVSQPDAYNHIERQQSITPTFLYGTSGAGKTRTLFEHLCRQKGFFLVSVPDSGRNPGSSDLSALLCQVEKLDVVVLPTKDNAGLVDLQAKTKALQTDMLNRQKVTSKLALLLYIRFAVHERLENNILQRPMSPYEWLLYQLFPEKFLAGDVFNDVFQDLANIAAVQGFQLGDALPLLEGPSENASWSVFVDEAQELLKTGRAMFCNKEENVHRSAFSAVVEGLWKSKKLRRTLHHAVFSGTGISFNELQEQAYSMVAKNADNPTIRENLFFSNFKLLDPEDVLIYIGRFLDLDKVDKDVSMHVAKWLRGRPRWSASFLEVYSSRKQKQPKHVGKNFQATDGTLNLDGRLMETIDRYLTVMTTSEKNRRNTWSAGGTSAYDAFVKAQQKIAASDIDSLFGVMTDAKNAIFKFHLGQGRHIFKDQKARFLIENGIAAVSTEKATKFAMSGAFDEPIIIEAGVQFFGGVDNAVLNNLINQTKSGRGEAFELLVLAGLRMDKNRFQNFLQSNLEKCVSPDNLNEWKAFHPPMKSAYGVLCLSTTDVEVTLQWLIDSMNAKFDGQIPPFCLPDFLIGPDLLHFLRHPTSYSMFRLCIMQSKFLFAETIPNQQEALRTLVSELLYHQCRKSSENAKLSQQLSPEQKKCWTDIKDKLINDQRPCLRVMVQTAKKTSSAVSGEVAPDGTSSTSKSSKRKTELLVVVDQSNLSEILSQQQLDVAELLLHGHKKPRAG